MLTQVTTMILAATMASAAAPQGKDIDVKILNIRESRFVDHKPKPKNANQFTFTNFSHDSENALIVTLELQGPALKNLTHYGKIDIQNAIDDAGNKLTLHENFKDGLTELDKEFALVNREHMYFFEDSVPEDKVRVELKFNATKRAASKITGINGTIGIRVGEINEVTIPAVTTKIGKKIADSTLAAAGIEMTVIDPSKGSGFFVGAGDGTSVTLQFAGDPQSVLEVELIDANGESMQAMSMWNRESSTARCTLMADTEIPADAAIKMKVSTGTSTFDVPFGLKHLELP